MRPVAMVKCTPLSRMASMARIARGETFLSDVRSVPSKSVTTNFILIFRYLPSMNSRMRLMASMIFSMEEA